jgi:anaerobic ribonucleoside-triphosphate reductase activating protein
MDYLNIYHVCEQSIALGPGTRYVIWVQGCLQNCKECVTPQSRPIVAKHLIPIDELAKSIVQNKQIDGITISGGEPFLQASNLAILLELVKRSRPEITVLVFSGYTLEQLTSKIAKALLKHIDLLIDGPYIDKLNDGKGLRGSNNQRLHFFTDRLLMYQYELENGGRNNEIITGAYGTHIIGIPRKDIQEKIFD